MATNGITREFVEELILMYKSQPALWHTKAHIYKNKTEKIKSWNLLLNVYRKVEKDATIETVKTKINTLRIAYRRELLKVIKSQKSGVGADEIYKPTLWYFKHFHFVRDQDTQAESSISSTIDSSCEVPETVPKNSKQRSTSFRSELGASASLAALKKKILEQQLEHARLEHEQRMMHSAEEHKLKMQILEAELKSKQK